MSLPPLPPHLPDSALAKPVPVRKETAETTASTAPVVPERAVTQVRALDPAAIIQNYPLPQDLRARLAGPPPAFQISVMAHMRELDRLPELPDEAPPDTQEPPSPEAEP